MARVDRIVNRNVWRRLYPMGGGGGKDMWGRRRRRRVSFAEYMREARRREWQLQSRHARPDLFGAA